MRSSPLPDPLPRGGEGDRWIGLAALVMLSGCAHVTPECARHGGTPWREITSQHFVVQTNLSADDARAAAIQLEQARASILGALPSGGSTPSLEVVVFTSAAQLSELSDEPLCRRALPAAGEERVHRGGVGVPALRDHQVIPFQLLSRVREARGRKHRKVRAVLPGRVRVGVAHDDLAGLGEARPLRFHDPLGECVQGRNPFEDIGKRFGGCVAA